MKNKILLTIFLIQVTVLCDEDNQGNQDNQGNKGNQGKGKRGGERIRAYKECCKEKLETEDLKGLIMN